MAKREISISRITFATRRDSDRGTKTVRRKIKQRGIGKKNQSVVSLQSGKKQSYIVDRPIKMVGYIRVDHLSCKHIETGCKTNIKTGKAAYSATLCHCREDRNEDIAQRNGGSACNT